MGRERVETGISEVVLSDCTDFFSVVERVDFVVFVLFSFRVWENLMGKGGMDVESI